MKEDAQLLRLQCCHCDPGTDRQLQTEWRDAAILDTTNIATKHDNTILALQTCHRKYREHIRYLQLALINS